MDRKVKAGDKLIVTKDLSGSIKFPRGDVLTVTWADVSAFEADSQFNGNVYVNKDLIDGCFAFADVFSLAEARPDQITADLSYREKIAEKIFVAWHSCGLHFSPNDVFVAADNFIAELEDQRKGDTQEQDDD